MKQKFILFTSSLIFFAAMLMSYKNGPGTYMQNFSGSVNSGPSGCMQTGCHNGGNYINSIVSVTLYDSTGTNIMPQWVPNYNYKAVLKIFSTAPKVGFQLSPAYYNGTDTVAAGTMSNASAGLHIITVNSIPVLEHSAAQTVTLGSVTRNFDWLSPNTTTINNVMFFLAVNNVNGDTAIAGDNSTIHLINVARNTASVPQVNADLKINAYPIPITDKLNVSIDNAGNGLYTMNVFDMQGKIIATKNATVNGSYTGYIDASSWASGMYHVQFVKGDAQKTIAVMK